MGSTQDGKVSRREALALQHLEDQFSAWAREQVDDVLQAAGLSLEEAQAPGLAAYLSALQERPDDRELAVFYPLHAGVARRSQLASIPL